MQDANCGSLLGEELHLYDSENLFTAETCEKTKLLEIDKVGFEMYMQTFLRDKYAKFESVYRNFSFLKNTKKDPKSMLSLVTKTNSKKVMANTVMINQGDPCRFVYFVSVGQFILLRNVDYITSISAPIEKLMPSKSPKTEKEIHDFEERLPFEDPKKYGGLCNYETKLMQIALLGKSKSFGDKNI
jgi:hypothetical protein